MYENYDGISMCTVIDRDLDIPNRSLNSSYFALYNLHDIFEGRRVVLPQLVSGIYFFFSSSRLDALI